MALLSSGLGLGGELGLRLLLSPGSSSILVRSACGIVGIGMPVYCTYKALECKSTNKEDEGEKNHWLTYWAVCGCLSAAESYSDRWVSWVPFYYHVKLAFLIWLQVPASNNGAKFLYLRILRPLLRRHQGKVDRLVMGTRTNLGRFVQSHQSEVAYATHILRRVALAALKFGQDSYQALTEPDVSPEPSPRPSPLATPTLLDAPCPSDAAPASTSRSPSATECWQQARPQRVTRRAAPQPSAYDQATSHRSPINSPPYRGTNASPLYSSLTTPPGPNTFPSGSPSVHQQIVSESQYVRSLRSMYRAEEPTAENPQGRRDW